MSFLKPLPFSERRKLAENLRREAEEKIAEAERIEEGINSDTRTMIDSKKGGDVIAEPV